MTGPKTHRSHAVRAFVSKIRLIANRWIHDPGTQLRRTFRKIRVLWKVNCRLLAHRCSYIVRRNRCIRFLYGLDYDDYDNEDNKDAYTPLTWLAGLTLAGPAGLSIAVQGQGVLPSAIGVYVLVSFMVMTGFVVILRAMVNKESLGLHRAFDRGSISFGRWMLSWSILLTLVFIGLAILNLIPGQRGARTTYEMALIPRNVMFASDAHSTTSISGQSDEWRKREKANLDKWILWLSRDRRVDEKQRQILVALQEPAFSADYHSFVAVIDFEESEYRSLFEVEDSLVFLVRESTPDGNYDPIYKILDSDPSLDVRYQQIKLPRDVAGVLTLPVAIHVRYPNRGDRILAFVRIKSKDDTKRLPHSPDDFRLIIRRVDP